MSLPTKRCAFLSTDNLEDFCVYDQLLIEPMAKQGWCAEEVSWKNQNINWNDYDVVVIRSTWDYQDSPTEFINCLEQIEHSTAQLENSLSMVKWNISKQYLQELEQRGVDIVPTQWFSSFEPDNIRSCFAYFDCQELILKPLVSANADHTYRLNQLMLETQMVMLDKVFSERQFMVQPFIENIITEGEYSLFYFAGEFSHSILKSPKATDFRVQEEHGGQLQLVQPEAELLTLASNTLQTLPEIPLYARLDFVRSNRSFAVMEIELIEPSLYFNMDPESAARFTAGFIRRFGKG